MNSPPPVPLSAKAKRGKLLIYNLLSPLLAEQGGGLGVGTCC